MQTYSSVNQVHWGGGAREQMSQVEIMGKNDCKNNFNMNINI